MPRLNALPRTAALMPLLHLHSFRFIGLVFLATGVVSADLAPEFAVPAAYGDLVAAALAFAALVALRLNVGIALPLVWLFNIVGALDLLYAIFMGNRGHIAGVLHPGYDRTGVVGHALDHIRASAPWGHARFRRDLTVAAGHCLQSIRPCG